MEKIRILVINPNSTATATAGILEDARRFAGEDFEVDVLGNPDGPTFIDTDADRKAAAPGMERILRENEGNYDGFVVACHCDHNVPLLRGITKKPVVGIGQASLHMAALEGEPFSVVTTGEDSAAEKREQVGRTLLQGGCVSVRGGVLIEGGSTEENAMKRRILRGARLAVEQDGARRIVPAITGFPGLSRAVEDALGVPVLDSLACAMFLARDLAMYQRLQAPAAKKS